MTLELFGMWVVAGAVVGFGARHFMQKDGYGLIGDIALGLVGSILGSVIFRSLEISAGAGLVVLVAVALIGASLVIGGQRVLWHHYA